MKFEGKYVVFSVYRNKPMEDMGFDSNATHAMLDSKNRITRDGYYMGLGKESDGDDIATFHVVMDKDTGKVFDVPTDKLVFINREEDFNDK